ncbi:hypothetical protein Bxe_A1154 [Paraburkholderia xenovorans LB400]|uniref:Uncharacterized protein n=1 Tax=Paraburkholderia xenovorans (strain LB400) TaxID=266265 RepID=Q13VU5_PARXL|nr:hypothetical protein Bxe_A1154 [Paraburkholderia xenovorans LB400]
MPCNYSGHQLAPCSGRLMASRQGKPRCADAARSDAGHQKARRGDGVQRCADSLEKFCYYAYANFRRCVPPLRWSASRPPPFVWPARLARVNASARACASAAFGDHNATTNQSAARRYGGHGLIHASHLLGVF